jgi:regulatory protein
MESKMIDFEQAEKFDALKTKILKYILYKKRTEQEIRQKFKNEDENMLEDAIEYLKEANYIDDENYIEKAINEYIVLKNMSIKEITFKLYQKGLDKSLVEDYICQNKEKMLEYEINSAKNIFMKKSKSLEEKEVREYLYKKGYMKDAVDVAVEEGNV